LPQQRHQCEQKKTDKKTAATKQKLRHPQRCCQIVAQAAMTMEIWHATQLFWVRLPFLLLQVLYECTQEATAAR